MKLAKALLAGSAVVSATLSGVCFAQSQQQSVKNVVLVHGAFADGSSWQRSFLSSNPVVFTWSPYKIL
jgi:hypothetical protein